MTTKEPPDQFTNLEAKGLVLMYPDHPNRISKV